MEGRDGSYAHGGAHYLDLVYASRERQVRITQTTQKRLETMFEETAAALGEKAARAKDRSLTRRWALDYAKEVNKLLTFMGSAEYDITIHGIRQAAENGTYGQLRQFQDISGKWGLNLSESFKNVLSRVPEQAVKELISGGLYTDGAGLSKRIWRQTKSTERDIGYIIERALVQKRSAVELAADLEQYVNDTARTNYDWGKCYPCLKGKSCSYEAQRLARTSINHAHQLATIRAAKDNPFIDGLQWLSAGASGRTCDWCIERDGKIYAVSDIPLDHPNGLCTFAPYMSKSTDEIAAELKRWKDGESNPKLDKWLGTAAKAKGGVKNAYYGKTKEERKRIANDRAIARLEQYAKDKYGALDVNLNGLDARAITATFKQMNRALDEFPILQKSVIGISSKDMDGVMSTDFHGQLFFNAKRYGYGNVEQLESDYVKGVVSGFSPKGTTWKDTGVHELGHLYNAELIKKQITPSMHIYDWNDNVTATNIVDRAIKQTRFTDDMIIQGIRNMYSDAEKYSRESLLSAYKSLSRSDKKLIKTCTISGYAGSDNGEAIAEAFMDCVTNGAKANPLSKKIIAQTRKELG